MPAKIVATDTFDTIENEVLFTQAALKADEDAADLAPEVDPWFVLVDEARAKDRLFRASDMEATAGRSVANVRLDAACVALAMTSCTRSATARAHGSRASSPSLRGAG
jgi:hypothetical protein